MFEEVKTFESLLGTEQPFLTEEQVVHGGGQTLNFRITKTNNAVAAPRRFGLQYKRRKVGSVSQRILRR